MEPSPARWDGITRCALQGKARQGLVGVLSCKGGAAATRPYSHPSTFHIVWIGQRRGGVVGIVVMRESRWAGMGPGAVIGPVIARPDMPQGSVTGKCASDLQLACPEAKR